MMAGLDLDVDDIRQTLEDRVRALFGVARAEANRSQIEGAAHAMSLLFRLKPREFASLDRHAAPETD
jgi:hypothetical protein